MLRVSAVIPLFNKGPYIERALRSVLSQTMTDFELIVVDDGSTDKGDKTVENLREGRIRLIRQSNMGVSAARNRGIAEAKGGVIAFLDADDEWLPEFLGTVMRLKDRYPRAGAFASAYHIDKGSGLIRTNRIRGFGKKHWEGIIPNYFDNTSHPVCSSAVAVKKEVFEKTGVFRVGAARAEDLDLWLRIAAYFPIAYSNEPLAVWHVGSSNNASISKLPGINSPLEESLSVIEKDMQIPAHIKRHARGYVARHKLKDIREFYLNDKRDISINLLESYKSRYGVGPKWLICLLMIYSPLWFWRLMYQLRLKAVRFVLGARKFIKKPFMLI